MLVSALYLRLAVCQKAIRSLVSAASAAHACSGAGESRRLDSALHCTPLRRGHRRARRATIADDRTEPDKIVEPHPLDDEGAPVVTGAVAGG